MKRHNHAGVSVKYLAQSEDKIPSSFHSSILLHLWYVHSSLLNWLVLRFSVWTKHLNSDGLEAGGHGQRQASYPLPLSLPTVSPLWSGSHWLIHSKQSGFAWRFLNDATPSQSDASLTPQHLLLSFLVIHHVIANKGDFTKLQYCKEWRHYVVETNFYLWMRKLKPKENKGFTSRSTNIRIMITYPRSTVRSSFPFSANIVLCSQEFFTVGGMNLRLVIQSRYVVWRNIFKIHTSRKLSQNFLYVENTQKLNWGCI